MAVLPGTDRLKAYVSNVQELMGAGETIAITKADLLAAINAADDWVNTNSTAFNNALPTAAKNNLTARQKARLLSWVIRRRYEVS